MLEYRDAIFSNTSRFSLQHHGSQILVWLHPGEIDFDCEFDVVKLAHNMEWWHCLPLDTLFGYLLFAVTKVKQWPILIDLFFVWKISASWWPRSKTSLNTHVLNFSVCLFTTFLAAIWQYRRNFVLFFELHRFVLHLKNCFCIVHRSFHKALVKFQYIIILCSFLMTEIGTKFWYVFKLHTSDLRTNINHRIQHIFFYRALQEFQKTFAVLF